MNIIQEECLRGMLSLVANLRYRVKELSNTHCSIARISNAFLSNLCIGIIVDMLDDCSFILSNLLGELLSTCKFKSKYLRENFDKS